jgi:hypothetical protein
MERAEVQIVQTVRALASKSSDSSLAHAALALATAYEETDRAMERMVSGLERALRGQA